MRRIITFSTKVNVLSFILCCGVVSQHVKWTFHDVEWLNAIQRYWFFILETCVPFFFMISGYLFFRTYQSNKWKQKLLSRVKSLLVPYVIWNVFYTIALLCLKGAGYVSNIVETNTLWDLLTSCFNSDLSTLWFVKYLMVFVCISPFMYYVFRNRILGGGVIIILLVVNAFNYYSHNMVVPLNINANNWIMFIYQYCFFAVGSYAALCLKEKVEVANYYKSVFGVLSLIVLSIWYWISLSKTGDVITNHFFRLLWCINFWFACDCLSEINIRPWIKYSFFIYCAHWILLLCAQGVTRHIYPVFEGWASIFQIVEYVWLPVVTVCVLVILGNTLKVRFPRFFRVITGNRG